MTSTPGSHTPTDAQRRERENEAFLHDLLAGLARRPRSVPAKYFYDERGSRLFDRICKLDEYYLTRAELAILRHRAADLGRLIGPRAMLIELGSGSATKTRTLLAALASPAAYVPVDISGEHLAATAAALARRFPGVEMLPVCADFTGPCRLPAPRIAPRRRAVYFPGSTIGNFAAPQRAELLARMAELAGEGGAVVVGVDLRKDPAVLEAAYNDAAGVTAEFNRNVLHRANRELGADFDPGRFEHDAFYNQPEGRIEMHLRSTARQVVTVAGRRFGFEPGETIHTENSYKFTPDGFAQEAAAAGLALERSWTDDRGAFATLCFRTARRDQSADDADGRGVKPRIPARRDR